MIATRTRIQTYTIQTVAEFEEWLAHQPELADKRFEFLEGEIIEKQGMRQEDIFIASFLCRLFTKTKSYDEGSVLLPELDSYINDKRKRIPDLAYFTRQQVVEAYQQKKRASTLFAIELLSDNESLAEIEEKVEDYFSAGAQLVWYVSIKRHLIYTFTAPNEVKILKSTDICSAAPVLPDFSFLVSDLFEVPSL